MGKALKGSAKAAEEFWHGLPCSETVEENRCINNRLRAAVEEPAAPDSGRCATHRVTGCVAKTEENAGMLRAVQHDMGG